MTISAKIPQIAYVTAWVMAGLTFLAALAGPIAFIPVAIIPLCAAIGIRRRRVWSAWGYAVYLLTQLLVSPLVLFRARHAAPTVPEIVTSFAVPLLLGILFLLAGRSLADTGASRGRAWPWITVSAVFTLPLFFLQAFIIPTASMADTLLIGDRILVQSLPRANPGRGEIIALVYPVDRRQTFVKRVVGVPGDRLRISGKILYRNGIPVNEPYAVHRSAYEDSYRDDFPGEPNTAIAPQALEMLRKNVVNGEVVVPPGKYFVLGDNRDYSLDSRYWGFVGSEEVIGKPVLIYDSLDQTTAQAQSGAVPPWQRHTRWNRLFRLL